MDDAKDNSDKSPATQEGRCRVGDLHLAIVAARVIVNGRARRWGPEMEARWDDTNASAAEKADAATSARAAEKLSRVSGQELAEERESCMGV